MNTNRFLVSSVLVFAFVFVYEWLFHGRFLHDLYVQTAHLWRAPAEMQEFFPLTIAMGVVFALFITYFFSRNYEGGGLDEGIRFGVLIGIFMGLMVFSWYAYSPIPLKLAIYWLVGTFIEGVGIGAVLGLSYKN